MYSELTSIYPQRNVLTIQYLRAFAAIAVVFYHIGEIYGYRLSFGAHGVDLFFVISGFVMWMVVTRKEISPLIFLKNRVIRIIPLYWLMTLGLACAATLHPNLFPMDHPDRTHLALSLMLVPHFNTNGDIYPLVTQGWTLNYEMFFYVCFGVSLLMPKRFHFTAIQGLLLSCVGLGLIFSPYHAPTIVYSSPLIIEFLFGIVICQLWILRALLPPLLAWLAIVIACGWWAYIYYINDYVLTRFVSGGVPAALIVLSCVSLEAKHATRTIRWLRLLGDASYSIYLTHYVLWLFFSLLLVKLGATGNITGYLVTTILAILGGVATYLCIEQPLDRFLRAKLG